MFGNLTDSLRRSRSQQTSFDTECRAYRYWGSRVGRIPFNNQKHLVLIVSAKKLGQVMQNWEIRSVSARYDTEEQKLIDWQSKSRYFLAFLKLWQSKSQFKNWITITVFQSVPAEKSLAESSLYINPKNISMRCTRQAMAYFRFQK